ncbi:MarR family winged helix-turn-helix transcriptional regulator [Parasphingopyxis lamellibrachiae]|uniref:DNA-binding MarR family transcriptional regulator n=1 Tax=Parasphingopyxis lamellibrachiae TaxID=680125 RepID=A0A3D9FFC7_9SPHN|nr:helix-turn-helix domain-containing protein [Parasphingopyxis lamellibrachiae]RED15791.1 DNA-binding MarR family transcriptional regulator [Parasphingopyxis lamellibrachiae]
MEKRTRRGEILTELILEIFRVNGEMLDIGNDLTRPHGLTSARWQVMGAVELAGQALTVSQIARRMGLARQGVQRIVNDLEKMELVIAERNLDHKRAPLFSISKAGEKVMAKIDKAQAQWVNRISRTLGEGELEQALQTLRTIRDRSEIHKPE